MANAKKYLIELGLFLALLIGIPLLLIPYFTSNFEVIREEEAVKAEHQKFLRDQLARQKAEERAKFIAERKTYLMGKFDPALRQDFVPVAPEYSLIKYPIYLRQETYQAYLDMRKAALPAGIDLKLASATRNFDYQKAIWEAKWTGAVLVDGENLSKSLPEGTERFAKILEYSAAPGTSRHHWGTDIDLNDATPAYFEKEKGAKEYAWLAGNAHLFGFCQTYNQTNFRTTGYHEEKWHWSYLPLARGFTEEYKNLITEKDITGFLGDQYVGEFNLIKNYVLGINPECL